MRTTYRHLTKPQEQRYMWVLQFSDETFKRVYLRRGNTAHQHHIRNTPLSTTQEVKELGMYVTRLILKGKSVPVAAERLITDRTM